ncbi:hypothetical protein K402DRAFT_322753 [Aulographum hederae CBS 113979]|uniref:Uncharacterized protein n=1 Tax=Aulographum hederae CBS 113979 TaxID=1176131 RepID=A0A6G1HDR9_9PEZI|nr:hypothetical protein K402DRAFT_322753 [Aulographum hederae CBS 113979]
MESISHPAQPDFTTRTPKAVKDRPTPPLQFPADEPRRVIIQACVTDIPGCPRKRFHVLGDDFCQYRLGRSFQWQVSVSGYDGCLILADCDSDEPLKRWFVYDFHVKTLLTEEEVLGLPHEVYRASRQGDKWEMWVETAGQRSSSYVWGGREEQKLLSELREVSS